MHRLIDVEKKRSKSYGYCKTCGVEVEAVWKPGLKPRWACINEIKAAKAKKATRTPKKSVSAIRERESKGGNLNATELKKLLRSELSRVVRIRDSYKCYVCGMEASPGILAFHGQAAHLRPINSLSPEFRYDPRTCKWMCGVHHSEFDGNTGKGRIPAYQLPVWSKLQAEEPQLYEWVKSLPKAVGKDKQRIADLRDMLEKLRRM